ncbi:NAD+ synthase [Candidatus Magnetomonas plexicatena]|uniref:NAD+ synthase n=1 Tax=Candidatus Magnetomonas plexicatena TaxID=2552947 RepID=UPI001C77F72F|nr:NAD+ synthase [Nitrospirales bacterium LBB_01]
MKTLRVALAQINPTVGDIKGNTGKIIDYIERSKTLCADIVAFPELSITGYPPEDLLLKPGFIRDNVKALKEIQKHTQGITAIIGFVDMKEDIYNAAAVFYNYNLCDVYHKLYLPNYGVFDEIRYFKQGNGLPIYEVAGCKVGVSICEDIWYPEGPPYTQALHGAEVIININASPYGLNKFKMKEAMLKTRAFDCRSFVAYLNMTGGQDELVFDGRSLIISPKGEILTTGAAFSEELIVADLDIESVFHLRLQDPRNRQKTTHSSNNFEIRHVFISDAATTSKPALSNSQKLPMDTEEAAEVYSALVMGTRDYVQKNGFRSVVIGLSGGIDSSLVAAIAVDALGKENVRGIFMPSMFTSEESRTDVYDLARRLDIAVDEIPIENIFNSYLNSLSGFFKDKPRDITEENLQARVRGNLLMAFSNKFGSMVLTTGNKSEMSVGYATLYGDMAGGFAVIKDVPKVMVYRLCNWRNRDTAVIPESVLTKAPTAELRENQKDTDSLPPYEMLDPIIEAYIENDMSFEEMTALRLDASSIKRAVSLIDRSEYKRRQSPPGVKITGRAFGKDRRFPITNGYRGV